LPTYQNLLVIPATLAITVVFSCFYFLALINDNIFKNIKILPSNVPQLNDTNKLLDSEAVSYLQFVFFYFSVSNKLNFFLVNFPFSLLP